MAKMPGGLAHSQLLAVPDVRGIALKEELSFLVRLSKQNWLPFLVWVNMGTSGFLRFLPTYYFLKIIYILTELLLKCLSYSPKIQFGERW